MNEEQKQSIGEAVIVLNAMKEYQPGAHIEILERGLQAAADIAAAAELDARITMSRVSAFQNELFANIPLKAADFTHDPNDEFKRCAVDRAERAQRFAGTLRTLLSEDTKLNSQSWSELLGVVVELDPANREAWEESISRAEFINRLIAVQVQLIPGSPLL